MLYSSINNHKIKEIRNLKQKKYRDKTSLFIVEGEKLVREAEKKGVLQEVFKQENFPFISKVSTHEVTNKVMKEITSLESIPKIIGICKKQKAYLGSRIVILEDVQDPGNIGTIIRSAVAFSADTIVVSKGCADPYSPKVQRAAQGMNFHISILEEEVETILPILKEQKIPIYGTKVNGGKKIFHLYKPEKFAIIMGNEGKGLQKKTLEACDEFLYIPMNDACESLNVGVATSILLYELDKRE